MKLKARYLLFIILILLFAAEIKSQDTEKFSLGVASYSSGNYEQALQFWMDIYNTGYRSASLNYNIGNTYFKMNDIPNAILFFERAYLLDPADENINYNLEVARTLVVDRFQEIPELFFIKWYKLISLILSTNTWAIISISGFILCLLFLSLYIYSSKYSLKVLGFWLALSLIVISLVSISFSIKNKSLVYSGNTAIIMDPQVAGKSSPDISGTDLFVLHEGTKVMIGDKVGEWYEIKLSDGNKGWIPAGSVNII